MNYSKAVLLSLKVGLFCCCWVVVLFLFCFVCLFVFLMFFFLWGCFGRGCVFGVFWGIGGVFFGGGFFIRVVVVVVDGRCVHFLLKRNNNTHKNYTNIAYIHTRIPTINIQNTPIKKQLK